MIVESILHRNLTEFKKLKVIKGNLVDPDKILLVFDFLAWICRNFLAIEQLDMKVDAFLFRLMCHMSVVMATE